MKAKSWGVKQTSPSILMIRSKVAMSCKGFIDVPVCGSHLGMMSEQGEPLARFAPKCLRQSCPIGHAIVPAPIVGFLQVFENMIKELRLKSSLTFHPAVHQCQASTITIHVYDHSPCAECQQARSEFLVMQDASLQPVSPLE